MVRHGVIVHAKQGEIMFQKVLVGYDGSETADDAIALARTLGQIDDGRVIAVRRHWHAPVGAPTTVEDVRGDLDRVGADIELRAVSASSAARALHDVAEEIEADLIVVGSTHRGAVGRVFPGPTGDRLLHGAPCAVAMAPIGYRDGAPGLPVRIGVAYCEAPEAEFALREALAIAAATGGRVEVMHAFEDAPYQTFYAGPALSEVSINAHEFALARVEDAVARSAADGAAIARLLEGEPVEALIEHAQQLDLLVMGSRGYGPIRRVLAGSVSHGVVTGGCPCPVIVTPRGVAQPVISPAAAGSTT
jgi:nucleotide-binding universal stress UspA family protein